MFFFDCIKITAVDLFDINIADLKNGIHTKSFIVDDAFFESLSFSLIKNGTFSVNITINKNDSIILLDFDIKGIIRLTCDRSLEDFDFNLKTKKRIVIRIDSLEFENTDDDLINISPNSKMVNVSQYIYEFICLSIPQKKLHPRFDKEPKNTGDEKSIFLYSTKGNLSDNSIKSVPEITDENQYISADWKKLKKMFNNN